MTSQQLTNRLLDLSALFQSSRDPEQREAFLAEMRQAAAKLEATNHRLPWN